MGGAFTGQIGLKQLIDSGRMDRRRLQATFSCKVCLCVCVCVCVRERERSPNNSLVQCHVTTKLMAIIYRLVARQRSTLNKQWHGLKYIMPDRPK